MLPPTGFTRALKLRYILTVNVYDLKITCTGAPRRTDEARFCPDKHESAQGVRDRESNIGHAVGDAEYGQRSAQHGERFSTAKGGHSTEKACGCIAKRAVHAVGRNGIARETG